MSTTIRVASDAADKRLGMTIAEVEAFIAAARRAGNEDDSRVGARAGFRGQLQALDTK